MATATPEGAPHFPRTPLPNIRGALRWAGDNWKQVGLAIAIAAGGIYLLLAHDKGPQKAPVQPANPATDTFKPANPDPGVGSEVVIPTPPTEVTPAAGGASASPEPPPTQEPTKAPPTPITEPTKAPIVEAEKDKPCTIVPQEYCSQAEVIDWTNSLGQKMKLIGFNLPAGVPLSMPIDGQVAKVKLPEEAADKGFQVQIFDPNNPNPQWYIFKGDMQFDNMFSVNMKKGGIFGHTQNTGIENSGYRILFYIVRGSGKDATVAEDEMKKMLPDAFTKPPAKTLVAEGSNKGVTITTKTFYDTPPK